LRVVVVVAVVVVVLVVLVLVLVVAVLAAAIIVQKMAALTPFSFQCHALNHSDDTSSCSTA